MRHACEDYNITENIVFEGGQVANNPKWLAEKLSEDLSTVIVISTSKNIASLCDEEATKEVIEILKDNPDKTSWIIMVEKVLKMN